MSAAASTETNCAELLMPCTSGNAARGAGQSNPRHGNMPTSLVGREHASFEMPHKQPICHGYEVRHARCHVNQHASCKRGPTCKPCSASLAPSASAMHSVASGQWNARLSCRRRMYND